jgi:hypothetical protein
MNGKNGVQAIIEENGFLLNTASETNLTELKIKCQFLTFRKRKNQTEQIILCTYL